MKFHAKTNFFAMLHYSQENVQTEVLNLTLEQPHNGRPEFQQKKSLKDKIFIHTTYFNRKRQKLLELSRISPLLTLVDMKVKVEIRLRIIPQRTNQNN